MPRQGNDLVAAVLDSSCLMDADMPRVRGYHCLVGLQHGINDNLVGLGAPCQEVYLPLGALGSRPYLVRRLPAVHISTVARQLLHVGGGQRL